MSEDFAPNFSDKRTGFTKTPIKHSHFHQAIFDKDNMTIIPHPPYFSLLSLLKIKLKGRHFDTTEVTEAESQTVLNTLTEHGS
jgi:hypothetical protein